MINDKLPTDSKLMIAEDLIDINKDNMEGDTGTLELDWQESKNDVPCDVVSSKYGVHWYYNDGESWAALYLNGHKNGGTYHARPPTGIVWNAPRIEIWWINHDDAEIVADYCDVNFKVRDPKPQ